MNTRLFLILIFSIFFTSLSYTQESDGAVQFRGKVKEFETNIPLLGVNVYVADDPTNGTSTSKTGSFKLQVKSLPAQIVVSFIGYETDTIVFDNPNRSFKTIILKPDIFTLPGIEITAKLKLDRLSDRLFSIRDFLMLEHEQILYLKKEGDFRGWELILATLDGVVLDTFSLRKQFIRSPESLHLSCFGNIHLLTDYGAFQMNIEENQIVLGEGVSLRKFDRLVLPCVGASDKFVYFERKLYRGMSSQFEIADKAGTFRRPFAVISDDEQLGRYEEDQFYASLYEELETAKIDFQMDNKLRNTHRQFQLEMKFRNRLFQEGMDIPFFHIGDSLVLLNYYDHIIQFFDEAGNYDSKKEQRIDFHLNKKWEKVIYDEISRKLYAVFNSSKGKYISEISLHTGEVMNPLHFECVFIRKIIVHDDFLYLLHGETYERNWVLYKVKF
ncbi:carboxypeptidase-like regulatory domain-containing protein [Saprospiraceae bacterium]|jgi:hypothetical protein|nr:carboxypeptidase-like regulatory domain-containing protein [Saprospiraceae bacterium]